MRKLAVLLTALAPLAGCGGHYILTVPDQLAPAGTETVTVCRLLRNDFFVADLPVREAAMQFRIGDAKERAAYTDEIGYAAAPVPVPLKLGRYEMEVRHMDDESEVVSVRVPVHVWDPSVPVVAVDLDSLPRNTVDRMTAIRNSLFSSRGRKQPPAGAKPAATTLTTEMRASAEALTRLGRNANIVYMTRQDVGEHGAVHAWLDRGGYPDGPVLLWQRQNWHIVRLGQFRIPKIMIESRLVGQLSELRKGFPKLTTGITTSSLAARSYSSAGLTCVMIGPEGAPGAKVTRRASWRELNERGL